MKVCNAGGSKSFMDIVKLAHLENPFKEGSIESIIKSIRKWILEVEGELV